MGERANAWQPPLARPQAWRDGDDVVFRLGVPLPPICVFCGAPSDVEIRNGIDTKGHPYGNLQVLSTRVPVCDDDRRRHNRAITFVNLQVVVAFVVLLLTGTLPGLFGLELFFFSPFTGRLPALRGVVFAVVVFFVCRFLRSFLPGSRVPPRPVQLQYHHSRDGYVWLLGADPRYLAQLPPAVAAR